MGNWQPAQPAGPNALSGLVVSPAGTLFAIDDHAQQLFRSDDEGQTWCYLATPAPPAGVFFSSDPARTLYLTASASAPAGSGARVFRSDDGGDTWVDPGGTLPVAVIPQLFPASEKPREMFAAATEGIWATRDGGEHWEALATGLRWAWIARHPVRKQELYGLATDAAAASSGVAPLFLVMSSDEGRTWSEVKAAAGVSLLSPRFEGDGSLLAIDQTGQLRVLGADGSWKTRGRPAPAPARFILGEWPRALYVGTGASGSPIRMWKSADDGNTWTLVYSHAAAGVTAWPLPSGQLLERSPSGLRASADDGQTWRSLRSFVQGPSLTRTAAGTGAIFLYGSYAFSRSDDQGASWTTTPFSGDGRIVQLIPDPTASDSLFALVAPLNATRTRVARSRDGGKTWADIAALASAADVLAFAVLPTTPPTLLVVTIQGVARSEDDGATWAPLDSLGSLLPRELGTTSIAAAPSRPEQVYALLSSTLHLSTDAGRSWTMLLPDTDLTSIVVDPGDAGTFYFRKFSAPALYKHSGTVRQLPMSVSGLALTPARPGVLYFTDEAGRLARTADEGQTVTLLNLPGPVRRPMFDPRQPDLLYVTGAGLMKAVVE